MALMSCYRAREILIASLGERPYSADDWRDALVFVRSGVLELVSLSGVRHSFGLGSILFLANLRLRSLRNPGEVPTVLSAVTRATFDHVSGLAETRGGQLKGSS